MNHYKKYNRDKRRESQDRMDHEFDCALWVAAWIISITVAVAIFEKL